jgi:hypothetical protein
LLPFLCPGVRRLNGEFGELRLRQRRRQPHRIAVCPIVSAGKSLQVNAGNAGLCPPQLPVAEPYPDGEPDGRVNVIEGPTLQAIAGDATQNPADHRVSRRRAGRRRLVTASSG